MRLKYPIRLLAASKPDVFLSRPSVARPKTSFSDSRLLEKAWELALRACAMLRREDVRDSCSMRLWESIFSVIEVAPASEEVVAAVSSAGSGD